MKFHQTILCFLFAALPILACQAQTVYGQYDPATAVAMVTASESAIVKKFRRALDDAGAEISNIELIASDDKTKFLLVASVRSRNSPVTSVAVELTRNKKDRLVAAKGRSVRHTCTGSPCPSCRVRFLAGGTVGCACEEPACDSCRCNHEVQLSVRG